MADNVLRFGFGLTKGVAAGGSAPAAARVAPAVAGSSPSSGIRSSGIGAFSGFGSARTAVAPSKALLGSINLSPDKAKSSTEQFQTEISTGVSLAGRLFVISSGGGSTLQVSDATVPSDIKLVDRTSLAVGGLAYNSQSVTSFGNLLAVALSPSDYASNGGRGVVRFYSVESSGALTQLADVTVGYLPDSIVFNANGTKLLIANEGEPISGYATDRSKDLAGSIGIIDIQGLLKKSFSYTELGFGNVSLPTGLRLSGPAGTTKLTDIEPEYTSVLGDYGYVTLQENNAVVKVNLVTNSIDSIFALGSVDYQSQLIDLTDKDGAAGASTFAPKLGQAFEGLRMPDAIAAYRVNGKDYFVTANEGDGRDGSPWSPYTDESRGTGSGQDLSAYRVKRLVDDAKVGSADRTTTFGGRSISLFDASTGSLLWDSGNTLQTIAVAAGQYDDTRSDDKGVEPEGVVVAQVNGRSYAFVGMERTKSSMLAVFDITDPTAGKFITSVDIAGSISPEGLHVVAANQSPTGRAQLIISNELSNSFNVFDVEALIAAAPTAGAGTFKSTMLKDVDAGPKLSISSLLTIGEFTNGLTPGSSAFTSPGILDGIGAFDNGDGTYTVLVNSELSATVGYSYQVGYAASESAAKTSVNIPGARISQFVVDKDVDDDASNGFQSRVLRGGLAYDTVIGADNNGFDRFCSSTLFNANQFGAGRGFADRLYITGEESNGALYVLDPASRVLREASALGKGSWENVAAVDTGSASTMGLLLFDDSTAPLYLWIGSKNATGDVLDRNGLRQGSLFAWKPGDGVIREAGSDATPGPDSDDLKAIASGTALSGGWVLLGDQTWVASKTATQLRAEAVSKGAMQFSRPEDGDTNPLNGKQVVFNTTGSSSFGSGDKYGNVIVLDFASAFGSNGQLSGTGTTALKVIYDGDKLSDPTAGLRSPDNLVWSADGSIYVQEDRTVDPWGSVDGSIWKLRPAKVDVVTGQVEAERWAVIDRQTPYGQSDALAIGPGPGFANSGEWESSGIVDVSTFYGSAPGTYLLADVQAHGLKDSNIWGNGYLVEGGQLLLIQQSL